MGPPRGKSRVDPDYTAASNRLSANRRTQLNSRQVIDP